MKNAEGFKFMKNGAKKQKNSHQQEGAGSNKGQGNNNPVSQQPALQHAQTVPLHSTGLHYQYKKKSPNKDQPFAHLGADFGDNKAQKVYRAKAPSHI